MSKADVDAATVSAVQRIPNKSTIKHVSKESLKQF